MMESQHTSSNIVPTIQNVISTFRDNERERDPKATVLIFASGKMVCTGAKSERLSELAARKCAQSILKMGFSVKFGDFKIQNIVANCDVKFPIRLSGLALANPGVSSYEPEVFRG
ncbi:hypothetical protein M0R45_017690 [Rubus argutus]|uniref:TATA-box binding protein n=1 Tax=Rubus argutus TaxID=59490 RepID=A0AAW1XWU4_RUBAR